MFAYLLLPQLILLSIQTHDVDTGRQRVPWAETTATEIIDGQIGIRINYQLVDAGRFITVNTNTQPMSLLVSHYDLTDSHTGWQLQE